MESHLEPAADQDQGPGAVTVSVTSDRPGAPLQPGEAERGSPDTKRGAGKVPETRAAVPGVLSTGAQGEREPGVGVDPLGGPQLRRREGQPVTGEEGATGPPTQTQEFSGGRERADQPLAGEAPSKEGGCSTE